MTEISILNGLELSVLGLASVFLVLMLLMAFIAGMNKIFDVTSKKKAQKPASFMAAQAPSAPPAEADGSCGDIKLYNVPDREAAMIMAIVADELKMPINEIRFISIREVESERQRRERPRRRNREEKNKDEEDT